MINTVRKGLKCGLCIGMAVLRFSHVNRRHEGTYKCLVSDATGKESYNTFNLKVIKKGGCGCHYSRTSDTLNKGHTRRKKTTSE